MRFLAQKLTEQVGGTFVVDNRPGAAGVLGAELVAKAASDRHKHDRDSRITDRPAPAVSTISQASC